MPELAISDLVTTTINEKGVAHVRLNRPEKRNALSMELLSAIERTGIALAEDKSVRAVVLSGEGKCFCAGIDISMFMGGSAGDAVEGRFTLDGSDLPNTFQNVALVWQSLPVPVIAALHDVVFGAGCQIALGADIRIARPDTRMSVMEIKWGLVPDMSATQTLRNLVRLDVAKELTFTGRVVEAQEAFDLGLVTRLAEDPIEEALKLAHVIAGKSPDAIAEGKKLFNDSWHASADEGLKMEQLAQSALLMQPNQIETVTAYMEKREGNYQNRK